MFAIELIAPFLIWMPRRWRMRAGTAIAALQVAILLTGNYTFFNWLTLALCLFTLNDAALVRWIPKRLAIRIRPIETGRVKRPIGVVAGAAVLTLSVILLVSEIVGITWTPATQLVRLASPFGIANNYGLFAVMTTERNEIVMEGSNDGINWLAYEFKYKPGDVLRAPPVIAPLQPRLDWQMWFAALGSVRNNPWFINFAIRLLEGRTEVTRLLRTNPFPVSPPRWIRATVYRYRFTDAKAGRRTGAWWNRELRGLYLRAISLDDVRAAGR